MHLKEIDGNLRACKTSIDVIDSALDRYNEGFLVSERVAEKLKRVAEESTNNLNFLDQDYWYLVIRKNLDQTAWEITVYEVPIQKPITGYVSFENDPPVLQMRQDHREP